MLARRGDGGRRRKQST